MTPRDEADLDAVVMEHEDTIPDPGATPLPAPRRRASPRRDPLVQELFARIGAIHALLEVDADLARALPQLRQAQRELDETAGWLADRVLVGVLLEVVADIDDAEPVVGDHAALATGDR